ncbi:MAG: PilZ domain-containing protein [Desulfuromonadales bacterium]
MPIRRFRRIPFVTQVTLSSGQDSWTGELLEIALKGALVETKCLLPFDLGTECTLCMTLPGSPISLEFQAKLIHSENSHYGFKFISEDIETLTHLRKLIELNTGDAETTRGELLSWLDS